MLLLRRMKRSDNTFSGSLFCCVFIQYLSKKLKACHRYYNLHLYHLSGHIGFDVITIVITDGKIKVSIGEQECQQVSGSCD